MSTTTIIVTSVLALLSLSVFLIWAFDRARLWDHFARSLVQMAIAGATVFVAFMIYDKQLEQRNKEELQRERLIVTSFLRSKILEVVETYKPKHYLALLNHTSLTKCDINLDVCYSDPARQSEAAQLFSNLVGHDLARLDLGMNVRRAEVWQLMRSAPLINEAYFTRLFSILDKADGDSRSLREMVSTYGDKRKDLSAMSDSDKVRAYNELVRSQAWGIDGAVKAVCSMNHLLNEVNSGEKIETEAQNRNCPPYSSEYSDFYQQWIWSRKLPFEPVLTK